MDSGTERELRRLLFNLGGGGKQGYGRELAFRAVENIIESEIQEIAGLKLDEANIRLEILLKIVRLGAEGIVVQQVVERVRRARKKK